MDPKQHWFKI